MIGFMPSIYSDELVYSWFCRYFVHAGYTANKMALEDLLYNRHCNPSKEFIGHLNPEMEQVVKGMYSIEELILKHTMFPQYARFIGSEQKKNAILHLEHDFCDAQFALCRDF
ncbi:MAG: TniQ family protein [Lachnospiraceae bacterium]|nr:TniQ family protein [Lachnospiraceae bacterium]MDE7203160.1 TniQ family protein [Lachnospiraceae bacterium]